MRFSLTGFIRLGLIFGVGVTTFAIWLGRLDLGGEGVRVASIPHFGVINGFVLSNWPSESRFLDVNNGQMKQFRLPKGDHLDFGSCSPWLDDEGACQLVGRWMHCEGAGTLAASREFGVARFSIPSGKVLNRVPVDVVPASHPCWYPGTAAKVLFAGSDGDLYQINFDDEDNSEEVKPRRITWECTQPGPSLFIRDPIWTRDPRMNGKIVVTLTFRRNDGATWLSSSRLWWLSLSEDGLHVESAGPMRSRAPNATDKPEDLTGSEERFPNIAATPDGGILLAYLWQPRPRNEWQLRLVPIKFDAETGEPLMNREQSRLVCENHLGELAQFSVDGSALFALTRNGQGQSEVVRFPTTEPLASN